jgi:hypothetical protein
MRYPLRHLVICAVFTIGGCDRVTPSKQDNAQLLALKSKCREDGEKVRAEWKRTYFQDRFSDEPEYSYSPSLKTCLWIGEYRGPSVDVESTGGGKDKLVPVQTHVQFILDVYTNKPLVEFTEHDGKQIGDVSEADFKRRKAELFGSR